MPEKRRRTPQNRLSPEQQQLVATAEAILDTASKNARSAEVSAPELQPTATHGFIRTLGRMSIFFAKTQTPDAPGDHSAYTCILRRSAKQAGPDAPASSLRVMQLVVGRSDAESSRLAVSTVWELDLLKPIHDASKVADLAENLANIQAATTPPGQPS